MGGPSLPMPNRGGCPPIYKRSPAAAADYTSLPLSLVRPACLHVRLAGPLDCVDLGRRAPGVPVVQGSRVGSKPCNLDHGSGLQRLALLYKL